MRTVCFILRINNPENIPSQGQNISFLRKLGLRKDLNDENSGPI